LSERRVSWARLGAEGAAIVVSILLAFAIDAWWDGAQARIEETEVLGELEEEFAGYTVRLANFERNALTTARLLEHVLAAGPPTFAEPPSVAVSDSAVFWLNFNATLDAVEGTLQALLASGRLELIRNRELRSRLAAWPNIMSDIRDNELARREFEVGVLLPYQVSAGVPLSRAFSTDTEWPTATRSDDVAAAAYREVFRDPGFNTISAEIYRNNLNAAEEYSNAGRAAAQIVELIRGELGAD
jgi:hypothetical protein